MTDPRLAYADPKRVWACRLAEGNYRFEDGRLECVGDVLHPNYRLLLETIYQLAPGSACEVGCGSGDNLYNLGILLPGIILSGFDFDPERLALLADRNPELRNIFLWDATWPRSKKLPIAALAFSHTVLMHVNGTPGYLNALCCLFEIATMYVVVIENWETHSFKADIEGLWERGMLRWKPHFYYRESPEFQRPHIIIASRKELPYEPLEDYNRQMVEPLLAAPDSSIGRLPGMVGKAPTPVWA